MSSHALELALPRQQHQVHRQQKLSATRLISGVAAILGRSSPHLHSRCFQASWAAQLGQRQDWERAVEVFIQLQMAGQVPSRAVINALMTVLVSCTRPKEVCSILLCRLKPSS